MEIKKYCLFYLFILILSALFVVSCGDNRTTTESQEDPGSFSLAPAGEDQKVYITPATMEYHLAGCQYCLGEKSVVWKSEAISKGYTACECCFPQPQVQLPPMVYVLKGDTHYHLAGCQQLNDTKQAIAKSDAIQKEYTPCFYCSNDPIILPEPHVYILLNDQEYYHIVGCPLITENKIPMLKTLAIADGYKPCPECCVVKNIHGGIVTICPDSGKRYHGYNCWELQNCNSKKTMPVWEASTLGYTACEICKGKPI